MEKQKRLKIILWVLVAALAIILIIMNTDLLNSTTQNINPQKIWVYVEIQSEMVRDTSDYYYFGQINKSIISEINKNCSTDGLFILSNIRYWNTDDLLKVFSSEGYENYKIFQIKDIKYLEELKKDPIYIYDKEELHESALKLRGL